MRNLRMLLTALVVATLPALAAAAVDPALVILDAKVTGLGALLDAADTELDLVIQQHKDRDPDVLRNFAELADARRRDVEAVLYDCATDPARCIPPSWLVSATTEECAKPVTPSPDPHKHTIGYPCPIREMVEAVQATLEAAEAQGLPRDLPGARQHLDAAIAAAASNDGPTAFDESCQAFRLLSCR